MKKVGLNQAEQPAQFMCFIGLLVTVVLVIYGWLISIDVIYSTSYMGDLAYFVIAFGWFVLGSIQFFWPSRSQLDGQLRLVAWHLLAVSYLLFVTGLAAPIVFFWLLLTFASYARYNWRGWCLSLLTLIVTALIDILLWSSPSDLLVTCNIITLVVIFITSFVTIFIFHNQKADKKYLERSRQQEILQRERTTTLINSISDAILSVDKNGKVRIYNAASLSLLDTNDDLTGDYIDKVINLTDQDSKTVSLFEQLKNTKSMIVRDDLWHKFNDDESIRLELTYSPIRGSYSRSKHGEVHDGYIIVMRDITKAKSLEEERDEFISVVSHELRTPIAIAEGTISNAQLILSRPDASVDKIKQSVDSAHDQVIFLAQMVNDLSTLSRAERGVADEPEVINIRELANKLFSQYSSEAKAKGLHFNLDLSARLDNVNVSRLYLEEVLQNFINNAIKYTKEGSVTLSIKQKNDMVTFTVKDTGIGMSRSDQARIFEKFWRSEDYRTRETSGSGLGLYVAAKLARKLNTRINLVSRLNHGSTFSFSLPVEKATARLDIDTANRYSKP